MIHRYEKHLICLVSKEKYKSKFHCYIIDWHSDSLRNNVSIYLNKKIQLRWTFKGGGGIVF